MNTELRGRSYALGGGGSGAVLCDVGALVVRRTTPAFSDGICGVTMPKATDIVVEHDVIA